MLGISARSLGIGIALLLAVGCRRDRAVSRLDTLPPLSWSSATEAESAQAPPAAPASPPGPTAQPAAPPDDTSTDDAADEASAEETASAEQEEAPTETEVSRQEAEREVATSEEDLARLQELERENQVLRGEVSILQSSQQMLAAQIDQLHLELTNLTELSAIADAYSVEAARLGMLLGTDQPPAQPIEIEPNEPTVPPGAEVPSAAMFGAVPMTPATPFVAAPSPPTIRGPSTPTVLPPAFQFGAPPAVRAQPLTTVAPTNFGATPIPPTSTTR